MTDTLGLSTLLVSAAVLAVALLRAPLRRLAGAQAQYGLWLLVPAVLLAAMLATLQPERPLRWQIELPAGDSPLVAAVLPSAPVSAAAPGLDWREPLLAAWLLGVLGCALLWSVSQRRLLRQPRLPAGGSAALVGAWRPRLCLPVDFRERFPATERRLILLHERLHAERGDTRWLALALVLVALQWFNPLAWWALRRLRADMELACDAALLRRHPDRLGDYRQALLRAQGLRLPLSATPCSSHPLIERLQMLPSHAQSPARRWGAALLISLAAGLAYAAQPKAPPEPPTVPAAPQVAAPASPPEPPALKAKAALAVPAVKSVAAATAVPSVEPAPADGYSKLRMDVQVSVNGQRLAPVLLLQTFNEMRQQSFALPDGRALLMLASGRPHREERFPGVDDLILLEFELVDIEARKLLAKPRLITKNGVAARIEFGKEGEQILRVDVLPRFVTTRLHDTTGALAELKRDIEAGTAPALHYPP